LNTEIKKIFCKKELLNYFLIIFFLIISYSCSSTSGNEVENTQSKVLLLSPAQLKAKINEQSLKLTSLDCEGDLTIDSPELNNSGSVILSIFKPDSIYSKLEGPFGISIACFLITRNNFIYYNIRENYVIKGPSTPLNLGSILRLKVNFDDLLCGYTSSYFFNDTSSANSVVLIDNNFYVLKISEAEQTKTYWVNTTNYYVEKYEINDKSGKTKLQIQYSDYELTKNIYSPKSIYITNPSDKQNLWISLEKKVFNNNRLKFKIVIPKSAKVIEW
jgi:outer membrane lipoprotein-sorting protein